MSLYGVFVRSLDDAELEWFTTDEALEPGRYVRGRHHVAEPNVYLSEPIPGLIMLVGPLLQQAVVVGDDRPYCVALIYPRDAAASDQDIQNWINTLNIKLPDYARIANWYRLPTALNTRDGLLTENGRPKRNNIEQTYQSAIGDLYETRQEVSSL